MYRFLPGSALDPAGKITALPQTPLRGRIRREKEGEKMEGEGKERGAGRKEHWK